MSVTQIALYQALFNIATVVLELPTGLVGDFFGKKFSIQVGVLLLFFHTAGMLLLSGPFLVALSLVEALATPFNRDPNKRFYMKLPEMPVKESASSPSTLGCLPRNQSRREWQSYLDHSLPKYLGVPSTYAFPFSISCSFSFCIPLRGWKRPIPKTLGRKGLT